MKKFEIFNVCIGFVQFSEKQEKFRLLCKINKFIKSPEKFKVKKELMVNILLF